MILYAGNILSKFGYTPTFIETLAPKLSEIYDIKSVSQKKNQSLRLLDMVSTLLKNKNKIKLVLIDSYSMRAFWYTYILARICMTFEIPYMPILRGGGYPDRLKSSPDLCRSIFSNSTKNISPSLYLKKYFEDEGYKVDYIPNFIPVKNYTFTQRENIKPRLLWVRSFDKTYNPVLAVEVLKKLKPEYPQAELCMVGPDKDGSLQAVKDYAEKAGVSESLKITGKLSKKEWTELSAAYDIFINTTDFDNHPVSVIEAMALGIPVISTDVGGIPFLIKDGTEGLLVKPGNADLFVGGIKKLINDSMLVKNITINGRKKIEEFDWEILKNKWTGLIDPVLNK